MEKRSRGRKEGNKVMEGNISLLRKKEPMKPRRKILDRYQRPKLGAYCMYSAWILRKRLVGCLSTVSQP